MFAYKYDDRDPGTKLYTGHIVAFSFQDFSIRALQYYEGKKINDGTLKSSSSFFLSKGNTTSTLSSVVATQGLLATSGDDRVRTMSLLGDIWCILTGGSLNAIVGEPGNTCDYEGGWRQSVMGSLANIFGGSNSDSSSYGNTLSSPTGVWYGSGAYTGSSPSQGGGGGNGTSPAS